MPNFLDALVDNPVVHALGHAAGSLWNMTDLAQRLRSAADQHQQLQQEMRVRDADLAMRQQQAEFNRQQTQHSDLANALSAGGRVLGPDEQVGAKPTGTTDQVNPMMIGAAPTGESSSNVLTIPGSQQRIYYPGQQEQAARTQQQRVDLQTALNKANDRQIPDAWADQVGLPRGTALPPTGYDSMLGRVMSAQEATERAANKPGKTTNLHPVTSTNSITGDVTTQWFDPTTGQPVGAPNVAKGAGRQHPPAAAGGGDGMTAAEKRAQDERDKAQKLQDTFESKKNQLEQDERDAWALKQQYFDLAHPKTEDGKDAPVVGKTKLINPGTGKEVVDSPAMRKLFDAQAKAAEQKALALQQQSKTIRQRFGWGEFAQNPEQAAGVAPSAQQHEAKPAAAAQPKVANISNVRSYAQQKGISESQAIREFQQAGYRIGQ